MKRNPNEVLSAMKRLPNGSVIATAPLSIQFPVRFADIELALIRDVSHVYGLFAICRGNNYALFNLNCYVELGKASIEKTTIGETEYFVFNYQPGDIVLAKSEVIANSNLIFLALDEFIFKGKIPWYVNYEDTGHLFDSVRSHAKSKARMPVPVAHFLAAYITRSKEDRTKFIRETITRREDATADKIARVPMRSVFWSAPGIVNKLSGAYFNDGVVSALNTESKEAGTIEQILK